MKATIIKIGNKIINLIVAAFLFVLGIYSIYSLWDNQQIYNETESVRLDLLEKRPEKQESGKPNDFTELWDINEDIIAWLTLDGTNIDLPILKGETTDEYLHKNVYGEYAISGSIFIDNRCDENFADPYTLIYGHHMSEQKMFGDLSKYKDGDFFKENNTGELMLPSGTYDLKIVAYLECNVTDVEIYGLDVPCTRNELIEFVENKSFQINNEAFNEIKNEEKRVMALSTCLSNDNHSRIIVIVEICDWV